MSTLKFTKMHGLGNDFMMIDAINQTFVPEAQKVIQWANRHTGVGFDQLLMVEKAHDDACDFRYRIFNADGGEVEQCGNGACCFMKFVQNHGLTDKQQLTVETARGIIILRSSENGLITVNMGQPRFEPDEIPFIPTSAEDAKRLTHIVVSGTLSLPLVCVNMGNPHAVILVEDVDQVPVAQWGSVLERHEQFPQRVNVEFMQIIDKTHARLRGFERGVGETLANGTGACAATVAGIRLGLLDDQVTISQTGGDVLISWQNHQEVLMTGDATTVFEGEITL
ncbi:MAG: diaminopimelate epimerase [Neisseriaceae bacterium]|nr:diaminopimelate epimerase [Neisseriaceae bacterium]